LIGRQLSHFYIVGLLGSGGMGDVYEAQDLRLPRSVALKVLKPSMLENRTAVRRFDREARLAASLNHPNICTILDIGEADGLSFIAMELLTGESLKTRLKRGALPLTALVPLTIDVVRGLSAAHLAEIVHRDITPGNIFITTAGTGKLLDFGLAKMSDSDDADGGTSESVTDSGIVPGTVQYLSPEQLLQRAVDRRTDFWGLGAVLYEAATGAKPFDAPGKTDVIQLILTRSPLPLRRLNPAIPEAFEQIVLRLLQRDPDRRYQRSADLLKDLEAVRDLHCQDDDTAKDVPRTFRSSVAVLPFAILGDEREELRGFRDGLASDLAWSLQQLPGVQVAARTSTDVFRGLRVRAIGEQLKVEHVIEGTVQYAAGRVRVTASLLAASTEERVRAPWRLDVPAADMLAAQDEAARQLASSIRTAVAQPSPALKAKPEAFVEFQRALHEQRQLFSGTWSEVIEHATRAVDIDAGFAPAHVTLADTYNTLGMLSLMKPRVAFAKARLAAEHALLLEPDLATAHAALGLVRFGDDWDWTAAEEHLRRALEIDPDMANARIHYSWLLMLQRRDVAALTEATRAINTVRSRFVVAGAAVTYFLAERYDEAIALCTECLEVDPDYVLAIYQRGQCYHMKGMYPSAHADLARAARLGNRAPFYLGLLGKSYGEAGLRERAVEILAELETLSRQRYVAPHCYVYVFYGLGEREQAFLHQEDAYRDGGQPLNYFSPFIRSLFSLDPTHRDRLRQMRLLV
jgi:serine/threonine-protein kinase